jgi:uncharacterized protein (TIGR00251 family)
MKRSSQRESLPPFARAVEGGFDLAIKVVPGASRSEIVGVLGDRLKIRVAAPPEGGKANRAVVELLQEWLGASDVEIVAGSGSAQKTVRIRGISALAEEKLRTES